ncbi:hypothetical protein GCM10010254_20970 [Streptomyces chromofuscus]|nr:hypothetical protein GCM10010254_20970 [Streptomyces chromofuscus]
MPGCRRRDRADACLLGKAEPTNGGLPVAERPARERIWLQGVVRFEGVETNGVVAAAVWPSERSVVRWRRHLA